MVVIARTDAESAKLLSSTVDVLDHEFIKGVTTPGKPLAETIAEAEVQGKTGPEIDQIEKEWLDAHPMCTFNEGKNSRGFTAGYPHLNVCLAAVKYAIDKSSISDKETAYKEYLTAVEGKSNSDARDIAKDILGTHIFWDWDRTSSISFICVAG